MNIFIRQKRNLFLLSFIVFLFFINAYNKTFNYKPSSVHQWRQSDCLSIAKNYYEEGMHFFEPKIHWQGAAEGKAVSEMPIINYTVATLWKIFGEKEGVYRIFNYLIFIISIFVLYNSLNKNGNSILLSFFLISVLLTSPLLVYYSYNFLADVPALSFAIMSFCFLYKFYDSKRVMFFFISLILGSIAVLLKASAIIPIALLAFYSVVDLFNINKLLGTEKIFTKKIIPIVTLIISFIGIYLWYSFAKEYNLKNHNNVFLIGILPIWEMKEKDVLDTFSVLMSDLFAVFMNRPMLFLFFISVVFIAFNFKNLNPFLKYAFVFSGLFFISFIFLFFQAFNFHDYYLTNLMIFPVIVLFCLEKIFSTLKVKIEEKRWLVVMVIILIVFNTLYAAAFYRLRVVKDDKICFWYPFFSKNEKAYYDLNIWNYQKTMGILEKIKPDLRNLGIKREDLFISIPDVSPNSSLYLMDQKGYSVSAKDFCKDTLWKERCDYKNDKFLVLNDSTLKVSLSYKLISSRLERIFKRANVEVYKIVKN